jgi:hypothetical protein
MMALAEAAGKGDAKAVTGVQTSKSKRALIMVAVRSILY